MVERKNLITIGMTTGIGLLFLVTCLVIFSQLSHDITLSQASAKSIPVTHAMTDAIHAIPSEHLLGQPIIILSTEGIPITNLPLRLMGIMHGIPAAHSTALIAEEDERAKVYEAGDSLPSGVKIHAITQNGVILLNEGQLEKLPLLRSSLIFKERS
jgi:hypothetical protein